MFIERRCKKCKDLIVVFDDTDEDLLLCFPCWKEDKEDKEDEEYNCDCGCDDAHDYDCECDECKGFYE